MSTGVVCLGLRVKGLYRLFYKVIWEGYIWTYHPTNEESNGKTVENDVETRVI